jgi:hypothetical protein
MDHLHWSRDPSDLDELHHPVIIAAFSGWNDAGDAATLAVRTLIESSGAQPLAEVDPEPFTDFATIRPQVRLDANRRRQIVWPSVGIWSASLPGADVLFVLGPEPSLRWRSFCAQIIGIAEKVQSPLIIAIGALLADVPHSRPVQLMGVTSDLELMDRFELEPSRYEGPTGIIGVLQAAASETGIPAASLWAAIPGYASQIPSPKAAASLMHRACAILGTPVPRSTLSMEIIAYENRLAAMINDDQELAVYVARLEALADELALSDEEDGPLDSDQLGSPPLVDDPDVLVSEVEKFLRDQKTD